MSSQPSIFVSSTYYDLSQVRSDLAQVVEKDLGYKVLMSESPSFPINPDMDTIENCKRVVSQEADILVLIIGGRYGYVEPNSEKSVTNLEYIVARSKGIPIYVFVQASMLSKLEMYNSNPDGNYATVVDNPKIFDFVNQIRSEERVWTFPFNEASDIAITLKSKLANLFMWSLGLRKLSADPSSAWMLFLSPDALRLTSERNAGWESKFLLQCMIDELAKYQEQRDKHRFEIVYGASIDVDTSNWLSFVQLKLKEASQFVQALNKILEQPLGEAMGPAGEHGDARSLRYIAIEIISIWRHMIDWSMRLKSVGVQSPLLRVIYEMSRFLDQAISEVETYPSRSLRLINEAQTTGFRGVLDLTMTIELSNQDEYEQALEVVSRRLDAGKSILEDD